MISIVANFYNSSPFIPRLVESVLAQTRRDWELICVNDCSPADDLLLLRRYQNDPRAQGRIRIIDLPGNVGISRAKHIGISEAKGEWITFIDGDDWLLPDTLRSLAEPAEAHGLDMVIGNCRRVYELPLTHRPFHSTPLRSRADYERVIGREEIRTRYLRAFFGDNFLSSYAYWGKLYRTDTLRRSAYKVPSVTLYEDIFFVLHAMLVSSRIMFVPYEGYQWRWGGLSSGSTLREKSSVTDFRALRVASHFNDFYTTRLELMHRHDIPDVHLPLLHELRHVLWTAFFQVAVPRPGSREARPVMGEIARIISLPAYRDLALLPAMDPSARTDTFLRAVIHADIPAIYSMAHAEYRRRWLKRLAKRLLSI